MTMFMVCLYYRAEGSDTWIVAAHNAENALQIVMDQGVDENYNFVSANVFRLPTSPGKEEKILSLWGDWPNGSCVLEKNLD